MKDDSVIENYDYNESTSLRGRELKVDTPAPVRSASVSTSLRGRELKDIETESMGRDLQSTSLRGRELKEEKNNDNRTENSGRPP